MADAVGWGWWWVSVHKTGFVYPVSGSCSWAGQPAGNQLRAGTAAPPAQLHTEKLEQRGWGIISDLDSVIQLAVCSSHPRCAGSFAVIRLQWTCFGILGKPWKLVYFDSGGSDGIIYLWAHSQLRYNPTMKCIHFYKVRICICCLITPGSIF